MTTTENPPLPTWEECQAAVQAGTATPLQIFLYGYGPSIDMHPHVRGLAEVVATMERKSS
jgi:hypothetical protein